MGAVAAGLDWHQVTFEKTIEQPTDYWAPAFDLTATGDRVLVSNLVWEDITESHAAANSATAAATSASAASASATAAGQSASSASQSQNTAQTAASNALVSQQSAAQSATDAAGSASSALAHAQTALSVDLDIQDLSADVALVQQAQANTDGFATAFAGLTAETSGGNIAGIKATSWTNPDGSGNATLELLGDIIVPGSLATNALTVGLGKNLLSNTDFSDGLNGWVTYKTGGGGNVNLYRRPPGSWAG